MATETAKTEAGTGASAKDGRSLDPESLVQPHNHVDPVVSSLTQALRQSVEDDESDDDLEPAVKERAGTFLSSWSVLANTILGVGMLALPWAAAQVGWVIAGIFLFCAAFFANFSLHLLSCVSMELGGEDTTFYSVCTVVAPKMRFFVDIAIAVKCFGVAVSYLQVIGQVILQIVHPAAKDKFLVRFLVIAVSVLAVAPVAYRRRIGKTRFTNWLSIGGILYVWALLIAYCVGNLAGLTSIPSQQGSSIIERTVMGPQSFVNVLTTIPVFIFSFTCHQNLFPVANEIKDPSVRRLDRVTVSAVLTAVMLYGACIVCGYSVFGSNIKSNFLLALPQNTAVSVGSVLMAISNALSFPLQSHPCRRSLTVLLSSCFGVSYEYPQVGERWFRRLLTSMILLSIVAVAAVVDDLGIVFEIVGTIGSNTICYIMPAYLYIQMFKGKAKLSSGTIWMAGLQLCVGLIVLPVCLFSIFYKALRSSS